MSGMEAQARLVELFDQFFDVCNSKVREVATRFLEQYVCFDTRSIYNLGFRCNCISRLPNPYPWTDYKNRHPSKYILFKEPERANKQDFIG